VSRLARQYGVTGQLRKLLRDAEGDSDRVSMLTLGDDENKSEAAIVVIRGNAEIELFRQWAERNRIFTRGKSIGGDA
jgi:hypothetical protein